MAIKYIYIFLSFAFGYLIAIKKPNLLFLYWLSLQPIIMPLYVFLFTSGLDLDSFDKLYFSYPIGVNLLFIFLFLIKFTQKRLPPVYYRTIIVPIILLLFFLILQGCYTHFSLPSILRTTLLSINTVCPLLLLLIDKKYRPERIVLKKYVCFVIILQVSFCILNYFGITVYPILNQNESFSNHLISGTFGRYNHMTNYLTTIYLFITYEYFEKKEISVYIFILFSIAIGLIVLFSGARMSMVLFGFSIIVFFLLDNIKRFHIGNLILLFTVLFVGWKYLIQSEVTSNSEANEGTGVERNMSGLSNFLQNDLEDDDSTVSLSFYLLTSYFNNPIVGNGYSYLGDDAYYLNSAINQSAFIADARLAYMIVEYGLVGVLVYLLLYRGIYKSLLISCLKEDELIVKVGYIYFFICTLTEGGFFDVGIFTMLIIYCFQKDRQPPVRKAAKVVDLGI